MVSISYSLAGALAGARAVFIDLDMTLADTMRGLMISLARVSGDYGLELPGDMDPRVFAKAYYRDSLVRTRDPVARWLFWRRVWIGYLEGRYYGSPMPCAPNILGRLAGRYLTAIVTGREVEAGLIIDELLYYGFPVELVRIHSTGDLWPGATKRDLYERLAERYGALGILRDHVVVISDSPRDLQYARELGFKAVGFVPYDDGEIEDMLSRASDGVYIKSLCFDIL